MFGRNRQLRFDAEKYVGNRLLTMPRCPHRLVVIDGTLDSGFQASVLVYAEEFTLWLETITGNVVGERHEAAEKTLLLWLRAAERSDNTPPFRMPGEFYGVYASYTVDMLSTISVEISCPVCQHAHAHAQTAFEDVIRSGGSLGEWKSGDVPQATRSAIDHSSIT